MSLYNEPGYLVFYSDRPFVIHFPHTTAHLDYSLDGITWYPKDVSLVKVQDRIFVRGTGNKAIYNWFDFGDYTSAMKHYDTEEIPSFAFYGESKVYCKGNIMTYSSTTNIECCFI